VAGLRIGEGRLGGGHREAEEQAEQWEGAFHSS
jgi:hypothetical protein